MLVALLSPDFHAGRRANVCSVIIWQSSRQLPVTAPPADKQKRLEAWKGSRGSDGLFAQGAARNHKQHWRPAAQDGEEPRLFFLTKQIGQFPHQL